MVPTISAKNFFVILIRCVLLNNKKIAEDPFCYCKYSDFINIHTCITNKNVTFVKKITK